MIYYVSSATLNPPPTHTLTHWCIVHINNLQVFEKKYFPGIGSLGPLCVLDHSSSFRGTQVRPTATPCFHHCEAASNTAAPSWTISDILSCSHTKHHGGGRWAENDVNGRLQIGSLLWLAELKSPVTWIPTSSPLTAIIYASITSYTCIASRCADPKISCLLSLRNFVRSTVYYLSHQA